MDANSVLRVAVAHRWGVAWMDAQLECTPAAGGVPKGLVRMVDRKDSASDRRMGTLPMHPALRPTLAHCCRPPLVIIDQMLVNGVNTSHYSGLLIDLYPKVGYTCHCAAGMLRMAATALLPTCVPAAPDHAAAGPGQHQRG